MVIRKRGFDAVNPQTWAKRKRFVHTTEKNAETCQRQVPKTVTILPGDMNLGAHSMKKRSERGFSLIELLLVVGIIGIIASLAVPHLQRGLHAAENGNMFATLRTISSTQVSYYSQNNRFGRLSEVNNLLSSSIGTVLGNEINRGKFVLSMTPAAPTDAELKQGFTITATRNVTGEGIIYVYELTQSGEIRQVLP